MDDRINKRFDGSQQTTSGQAATLFIGYDHFPINYVFHWIDPTKETRSIPLSKLQLDFPKPQVLRKIDLDPVQDNCI
jgi:hypothetical protein